MNETILVVVDDKDVRFVAQQGLLARGYTVLETGDPQRAGPEDCAHGAGESSTARGVGSRPGVNNRLKTVHGSEYLRDALKTRGLRRGVQSRTARG
jgi:hypothetical protein